MKIMKQIMLVFSVINLFSAASYASLSASKSCLYTIQNQYECKEHRLTAFRSISSPTDLINTKAILDARLDHFSDLCRQVNLWNGQVFDSCELALEQSGIREQVQIIGTCSRSIGPRLEITSLTQWHYYATIDISGELLRSMTFEKKNDCETSSGTWTSPTPTL